MVFGPTIDFGPMLILDHKLWSMMVYFIPTRFSEPNFGFEFQDCLGISGSDLRAYVQQNK